jgi:hypothetical protein
MPSPRQGVQTVLPAVSPGALSTSEPSLAAPVVTPNGHHLTVGNDVRLRALTATAAGTPLLLLSTANGLSSGSSLPRAIGTHGRRTTGMRDSRPSAPAPTAPAPSSPTPVGTGVESSAAGGSGFFFFCVAALAALAALFVPCVTTTLRIFGASRAPQLFVVLLERPG